MRQCCCRQVLGDPDRLRGILLNLYTNAAKFTKRGAIALRVSVTGPNYRRAIGCGKPYRTLALSIHYPSSTSGIRGVCQAGNAFRYELHSLCITGMHDWFDQLLTPSRCLGAGRRRTRACTGGTRACAWTTFTAATS